MAADHPLDLMAMVSGFLEVLDGSRPGRGHGVPPRHEFLAAHVGTDQPESTALLTVWQHLTPYELERRMIAGALAPRRHRLPRWLSQLDAVRVVHVMRASESFGDADQYLVEVRWPDDTPLTITAHLDANAGHALVDAMALPTPLAPLLELAHGIDDLHVADADPADARARVQEGIDASAAIVPPIETESWPMARPLLEWVLRMLPEGGSGYPHIAFDPVRAATIAADFVISSQARGLDKNLAAGIVEEFCWFAAFNCGDPLRWSPTKAAYLLGDWWARNVSPDAAADAAMPDVLKAFVRYCAARTQLPPMAVTAIIEAVDGMCPEYERQVHGPRIDSTSLRGRVTGDLPPDEVNWSDLSLLDFLALQVGGRLILEELDTTPLPDEAFDWASIPDDVRPKVAATLDAFDSVADAHFGVEFRTAGRRLLARVAASRPDIFRRPASDTTAACAVALLVAQVNEMHRQRVTHKMIAGHFGLTSPPSSRLATFRTAVLQSGWRGPHGHISHLGLLTSQRRRAIIDARDRWLARET